MKRPIDKSKKANVKCEHCMYWSKETPTEVVVGGVTVAPCTITGENKNYWNRCKSFDWKTE